MWEDMAEVVWQMMKQERRPAAATQPVHKPHPDKALTAVRVAQEKRPGRYADGNGLYLVVEPAGSKYWVQRLMVQRRRRDLSLGGVNLVPLAEARSLAVECRKVARAGGDPFLLRDQLRAMAVAAAAAAAAPTFEKAAEMAHAALTTGWTNAKHAAQWLNTLRQHAFPLIGNIPVNQITTADLLRVLSPIWLTVPETARRVRQRLDAVLDWSKAASYRTGPNPIDDVALGLPKQPARNGHFPAMSFADVPQFFKDLRDCDANELTKQAFAFLILTATRTNETQGAMWPEFDLAEAVWTVPPERTKSRRPHRVPLPPVCLAILSRARQLAPKGDLVFPGRKSGRPLSNMTFSKVLERMQIDKAVAVPHGFRSSFRDWAAERTPFPREVCEMVLGHVVGDKTEAAYRRGDLFDKRRELMTAWAVYCTGQRQVRQKGRRRLPSY